MTTTILAIFDQFEVFFQNLKLQEIQQKNIQIQLCTFKPNSKHLIFKIFWKKQSLNVYVIWVKSHFSTFSF